MRFRKQWLQLVELILIGIVFVLAGCGTVYTHPSKVRSLLDEVRATILIGDTRDEVRTLLGKPFIDGKDQRLEVYRFSGRDIYIDLTPFPLPVPSDKVWVGVLVIYDENEKVKELDVDISEELITAGGFRFVALTTYYPYPETLMGPWISWDELSQKSIPEGLCSLVLFMGECPMEIISLDNKRIADFRPGATECDGVESGYFGAYIEMNITPGKHRLKVHQTIEGHGRDFENVFDCKGDDRVYVELRAKKVKHSTWSVTQLEGNLVVSKAPLKKHIIGATGVSPILWHRGTWYGPPTNLSTGNN